MALAFKFTTGTGAPAASLVAGGAGSIFFGLAASSAESGNYYLKLWWEGTGTPPPSSVAGSQPSTSIPVPGTTLPSATIPIPSTGLFNLSFNPINNGGRLWFWVTKNAADLDATALAAGGDVITLFYA
jgi:hypothetical protein